MGAASRRAGSDSRARNTSSWTNHRDPLITTSRNGHVGSQRFGTALTGGHAHGATTMA